MNLWKLLWRKVVRPGRFERPTYRFVGQYVPPANHYSLRSYAAARSISIGVAVTPGLLILGGCDGHGPADPSHVDVFDGATDAPVAAQVDRLDGRVSVTAPGYLVRIQRPGDVFLWPAPAPDRVDEVAFGRGRMRRWRVPEVRHCLEADVDVDVAAQAVAVLEQLTATTNTGPCRVMWVIDSAEVQRLQPGAGAFTTITHGPDHAILTARIAFNDAGLTRVFPLALHELGHAFGLHHSTDPTDVMHPAAHVPAFSQLELVALRLMYRHRTAGAAFSEG